MGYYNDEIIDTHMHFWDLKNDYPWLKNNDVNLEKLIGNYDVLKENFLPDDYIKMVEKHNIRKTVHIEVLAFPNNPVLETKWLQEQYEKHKIPNAIIAYADLSSSNVEDILNAHSLYKNMRGIRMPLNHHDTIDYLRFVEFSNYMQDPKWLYGFSLLEKYNLLFEAQLYPHQVPDLKEVATRYPKTTIVLEHFGWPLDGSDSGFIHWKNQLQLISTCSNVVLKLSNVLCSAFENIDKMTKYIQTAIEIFGANRCMFGSNCPPDTVKYDFDTIMHIYKSACSIYALSEQRKIFYENAARIYNI